MTAACLRCDGYEFVDDAQGGLTRCPECGPLRSYCCPAHEFLVGVRAGHLVGRCSGCAGEAARAITALRIAHPTTAATRSDLDSRSAGGRRGG